MHLWHRSVELNMPHSFGGSVTVSGLSFRYVEYTATAQLVSAVCSTASWSSATRVQCLASALWDAEGSLYDVMRAVEVTVGGVVGTSTEASASMRLWDRSGAEHAAQLRGICDSERAELRAERVHSDGTAGVCGVLDTSWSSATRVQCLASALWDAEGSLYDVMRAVEVTVGGVVGTSTEAFSFDAPVGSFVALNVPQSGRGSVTVSGLSFGLSEYTASAAVVRSHVSHRLGSRRHRWHAWAGSRSSRGELVATVEVTVGGFVGTGLDVFSVRCACGIGLCAECTADWRWVCDSDGAGVRQLFEYTATAALGSAACSTSSWTSASSVVCQAASYYGYAGYVEVTVGAMSGTGAAVHTYDPGRAGVFSFDAPVVSGSMLNAPHSGDGSVTVSGLSFGSSTTQRQRRSGLHHAAHRLGHRGHRWRAR